MTILVSCPLDSDRPGNEVVVEPLEIDDASGFVEGDAPEDVVESRVGRHARDDGSEGVQEVGAESINLKKIRSCLQRVNSGD